jgi:hypothetical protein
VAHAHSPSRSTLSSGGAGLAPGGPRSSSYRGVRWHERNSKWEARIFDGSKQRSVGGAPGCWSRPGGSGWCAARLAAPPPVPGAARRPVAGRRAPGLMLMLAHGSSAAVGLWGRRA